MTTIHDDTGTPIFEWAVNPRKGPGYMTQVELCDPQPVEKFRGLTASTSPADVAVTTVVISHDADHNGNLMLTVSNESAQLIRDHIRACDNKRKCAFSLLVPVYLYASELDYLLHYPLESGLLKDKLEVAFKRITGR